MQRKNKEKTFKWPDFVATIKPIIAFVLERWTGKKGGVAKWN